MSVDLQSFGIQKGFMDTLMPRSFIEIANNRGRSIKVLTYAAMITGGLAVLYKTGIGRGFIDAALDSITFDLPYNSTLTKIRNDLAEVDSMVYFPPFITKAYQRRRDLSGSYLRDNYTINRGDYYYQTAFMREANSWY